MFCTFRVRPRIRAAGALLLALAACTPAEIQKFDAGTQKVIDDTRAWVVAFKQGADDVAQKLAAGYAATVEDLRMECGNAATLNTVFQGLAAVSATVAKAKDAEQEAMSVVNAACSAPEVTDAATATATVIAGANAVKQAIRATPDGAAALAAASTPSKP
ncbi:MAG TPA: hypothetical protein VMU06_08770 [Stellaceae bacterium]|nr:hypothetical protein [Stellaceae bacterium]